MHYLFFLVNGCCELAIIVDDVSTSINDLCQWPTSNFEVKYLNLKCTIYRWVGFKLLFLAQFVFFVVNIYIYL